MASTDIDIKPDEEDQDEMMADVDELEINTEDDDDDDDNEDNEDNDDDEVDDDDDDKSNIQDEEPNDIITTMNENTLTGTANDDVLEDSDDEDYEYDEDILKKLEAHKPNINEIHPQLVSVNNEELKNFTTVVKNKYGIIVDNLHKTVPILSKYEYTKILGQRVKQLNSGSKPFINSDKNINNYNIAELELQQKKIPIVIKRPLPSGGCEYWKLQDLQILV